MFTRMNYKLDTPTKNGYAVVKLMGSDRAFTLITKTVVHRFPKVPIPGRDSITYTTKLVQTFHNELSAVTEYNRQKAHLEHASWERTTKPKVELEPVSLNWSYSE